MQSCSILPRRDRASRPVSCPVLPFRICADRIRSIVEGDEAALGHWLTLSHWCDDTLGTQIVRQINDQLIKWCEAFLDEGHATWAMPEREKGLYTAWKASPLMNGLPAALRTAAEKSRGSPTTRRTRCWRVSTRSAFPFELRQDYLSLQLTALARLGRVHQVARRRTGISLAAGVSAASSSSWPFAFGTRANWCRRPAAKNSASRSIRRGDRLHASHPEEYYLRRQRVAGRLPALYAEEVDRLAHQKGTGWKTVLDQYEIEVVPRQAAAARRGAARTLLALAQSLEIDREELVGSAPETLKMSTSGSRPFRNPLTVRYG